MKTFKLSTLLLFMAMVSLTFTSCSKDDDDDNGGGGNNETVTIKDDGTVSGGHIFSAVDDKNFFIDYIKYTVESGHLEVTGYDKTGLKGDAKIVSQVNYKGNVYQVLTIGKVVFIGCSNITSITIPNTVTRIRGWAFAECPNLKSVTIPNSVTTIEGGAFYGCSGLTSPVYNKHCFVCMPESYKGAYSIPDGIEKIVAYAFYDCTSLTSVTIPNSVTTIESDAFFNCSGLTSISIPNSVTTIESRAFYNCM